MSTRRKIYYALVIVLLGAILLVLGVLLGMNLVANNTSLNRPVEIDNDNTSTDSNEEETEQDEEIVNDQDSDMEDVVATFESERYDVSFDYPESWGQPSVQFREDYFHNENITFPNTNFGISYWRFEGGFAGSVETGNFETMQGYTANYNIFTQGVNDNQYGVIVSAYDPNEPAASVFSISQGNGTLQEAQTNLQDMRALFERLSFDFSNIDLEALLP